MLLILSARDAPDTPEGWFCNARLSGFHFKALGGVLGIKDSQVELTIYWGVAGGIALS